MQFSSPRGFFKIKEGMSLDMLSPKEDDFNSVYEISEEEAFLNKKDVILYGFNGQQMQAFYFRDKEEFTFSLNSDEYIFSHDT